MRVISQDGRISVPFDYTIFMVEENNVLAVTTDSPFHRLMATYDTPEKALSAFGDMHYHYRHDYEMFQFK